MNCTSKDAPSWSIAIRGSFVMPSLAPGPLLLVQPLEYIEGRCRLPFKRSTLIVSLKVVVWHLTSGPTNEVVNVQLCPHGELEAATFLEIKVPFAVATTDCLVGLLNLSAQ
jgi:hypothetical protein